jgi:hypothetical protein
LPRFQLYDLERDPAEQINLIAAQPEVVQRLGRLLRGYITEGRSTPGCSAIQRTGAALAADGVDG